MKLWRENSLTIVAVGLFVLFLLGHSVTGLYEYNQQQDEHDQPPVSYGEYLGNGHFLETFAENAESEFLQMGLFVWLTTFLHQRGSPESKKLSREQVDKDPRRNKERGSPWPVERGGFVLAVYERSLTLLFAALFVVFFLLHAWSGSVHYSEEQIQHGGEAISMFGYMATSRFWFESLQNWQSEMLAVAAIVVFSIFLRQRGSPESKPVAAPHTKTGSA